MQKENWHVARGEAEQPQTCCILSAQQHKIRLEMARAPSNEIMKPCLLRFLVTALGKHYDLCTTRLDNTDCRPADETMHDNASQTVICQ